MSSFVNGIQETLNVINNKIRMTFIFSKNVLIILGYKMAIKILILLKME